MTYDGIICNPFVISTGGTCSLTVTTIISLFASTTVGLAINVSGGTKVVGVNGTTYGLTYFSGFLIG